MTNIKTASYGPHEQLTQILTAERQNSYIVGDSKLDFKKA